MPVALADAPIYSWRGRIGVIVPPTNTVNEAEWNMMAPPGVTIHAARMALHTDTTSTKGKRALRRDLRKACADLAQAGVDAIAYGCTAGSMVSPVTELSDFMTDVSGVPAVTTAGSLIAALRVLGAARISVATPYHDALNEHERAFLAAHGIETLRLSGLGLLWIRHELQIKVKLRRNARSHERPDDADVADDGNAPFVSCKTRHFHAKRHVEQFRFRQSIRDGLLYSAISLLCLINPFQRRIEINSNQTFAFERVAEFVVPRGPEAVSSVALKRAVMDLLYERYGGFDDNFCGVEHLCETR